MDHVMTYEEEEQAALKDAIACESQVADAEDSIQSAEDGFASTPRNDTRYPKARTRAEAEA